jgi:hypothetical protein
MTKMIHRIVLVLSVFFVFSCTTEGQKLGVLEVSETAGLDRPIEYVAVEIILDGEISPDKCIAIVGAERPVAIKGQVTKQKNLKDKYVYKLLFPVKVRANEVEKYSVEMVAEASLPHRLYVEGEGLEITVENGIYKADLRSVHFGKDNEIGPGQLGSLTIKDGNVSLKRKDLKIHWAPNFQKKGLDYKTHGHIRQYDSIGIVKGEYMTSVYREGHVPGYEEIKIYTQYDFYSGLPYFEFYSKMEMRDSVRLEMLRNDEMTLDSLFTHLVYYSDKDKLANQIRLYDNDDLNKLKVSPIETNAKWLLFCNKKLGYALGSVRLDHNISNESGFESPTFDSRTWITKSKNGGRYWDRRFLHGASLNIPKGSQYQERNAYVVLTSNVDEMALEMTALENRLKNPLIVKYRSLGEE